MPLRNDLFGVFKIMKVADVNGTPQIVLGTDASQSRKMDVKQQNYIQGTAEARILDIGFLEETININAPILVGGASRYDGRTLLNTQIFKASQRDNKSLPILSKANLTVDSKTGGKVSLTLQSDGRKSTAFTITNDDPPPELDPTGSAGPTRVARNYDFLITFGPYQGFVTKADISVAVETQKEYFFIPIDGVDVAPGNELSNPHFAMGSQFPYLGVAGIKVSGNGTAAIVVGGENDPTGIGESLTLQTAGNALATAVDFNFLVYDGGSAVDLFSYNGTKLVDLSKSVIDSTDFKISTGILTVNFSFTSWVKIH